MLRAIVCCLLPLTVLAADPTVTLDKGAVVVNGVADATGLRLVVTGGTDAETAARPAMSGEWTTAPGKVVFAPKYPLKAGATYRLFLAAGKPIDVRVPAGERPKTAALTGISPSAPDIPENVLRFYLHFDHPMPRGNVYQYVRVLADDGRPVAQPFLKLDDELWNENHTRLTLLIEPGRIKREVKPLLDLGPVFVAGKKYTLVVSGDWPTLSGDPLGRDVRKAIEAAPRLDDAPDPKRWAITPPAADRDPLKVAFGRPMDSALLARTLTVLGPDGTVVRGVGAATDADRGWTFTPAVSWAPGTYRLRVSALLEDVCGNAIGKAFEVDLGKSGPKAAEPKDVDVPFTVSRR